MLQGAASVQNMESGVDAGLKQDTMTGEIRAVLYRYCLKLTGSVWDAEDLVQETCLRALSVIVGAHPHSNPTAYVLRIAKNLWVDIVRRRRAAEKMIGQSAADAAWDELHDHLEVEEALRLVVKHLSPLQRAVFLLREVCGYKSAEAAGWLQTTEGAVKAALHRARNVLEKVKQKHESSRAQDNSGGGEEQEGLDPGLLHAYLTAIRRSDPQALVYLALAQNDPVQALGGMIAVQQSSPGWRKPVANTFHMPAQLCAAA
ncbi:RNA polymerase sigma factor [Paenibacillus oenotherae]|nr:RNA polymerase sigma factor [Paenibacillus oenotherae]